MKHIIVIETAEHSTFGQNAQAYLTETIQRYTDKHVGFCVVQCAFNEINAIAAVHTMFNAPAWTGGAG